MLSDFTKNYQQRNSSYGRKNKRKIPLPLGGTSPQALALDQINVGFGSRKLHFGSKGGIYYKKNGKKIYLQKPINFGGSPESQAMDYAFGRKLYRGNRGGVYYKSKGKKVYVNGKGSNFGMGGGAVPGVLGGLGSGYVDPSFMESAYDVTNGY